MTTLEGNKLIAEFMGWAYSPNVLNDGMPTYTYRDSGGTTYATEYMFKYHSSWDWLMPVWFKIQNWYTQEFGVMTSTFEMSGTGINIQAKHSSSFKYASIILKREITYSDVWAAIVMFLKWYNSQPKTDNNDK